MEAAFYFGLDCGRSNGNRSARPIIRAMLPGSGQAASHRRGVGGVKWIALTLVHVFLHSFPGSGLGTRCS